MHFVTRKKNNLFFPVHQLHSFFFFQRRQNRVDSRLCAESGAAVCTQAGYKQNSDISYSPLHIRMAQMKVRWDTFINKISEPYVLKKV
jgi:hypothetical protein